MTQLAEATGRKERATGIVRKENRRGDSRNAGSGGFRREALDERPTDTAAADSRIDAEMKMSGVRSTQRPLVAAPGLATSEPVQHETGPGAREQCAADDSAEDDARKDPPRDDAVAPRRRSGTQQIPDHRAARIHGDESGLRLEIRVVPRQEIGDPLGVLREARGDHAPVGAGKGQPADVCPISGREATRSRSHAADHRVFDRSPPFSSDIGHCSERRATCFRASPRHTQRRRGLQTVAED